jgi:hypothetical protein
MSLSLFVLSVDCFMSFYLPLAVSLSYTYFSIHRVYLSIYLFIYIFSFVPSQFISSPLPLLNVAMSGSTHHTTVEREGSHRRQARHCQIENTISGALIFGEFVASCTSASCSGQGEVLLSACYL